MFPYFHTTRAAVIALTLLGMSSVAAAQDWVAVSNNQSGLNGAAPGTGTLVSLNAQNGNGASQATQGRAGFTLAWAPDNGMAYTVRGLGGGVQELVHVNPSTLAPIQSVGPVVDSVDPSFMHTVPATGISANGSLYGVSVRPELIGGFKVPVGVLVQIDRNTAVATQVGSLGVPVYSRGGAVSGNDFMLLTSTNKVDREFQLYRINLTTGAATHVGGTGVSGMAAGLAADDQGRLLAVMDGHPTSQGGAPFPKVSKLYDISPSTGKATLVGSTGFDALSGFSWMLRPPTCGVVSGGSLTVRNNAIVHAYACDANASVPQFPATLCSNADISVANMGIVEGNVVASGTVSTTTPENITGTITTQAMTNNIPTVDLAAAQANNNNASIPLTSSGVPAVDSRGQLQIRNGDTLTLTSGTYYFTKLEIKGGAIDIVGDVTIVVSGEVEFENTSYLNASGAASNLTIKTTGKVKAADSAIVNAVIIAPNSNINIANTAIVSGYVVGDTVTVSNNAQLLLADCLAGAML